MSLERHDLPRQQDGSTPAHLAPEFALSNAMNVRLELLKGGDRGLAIEMAEIRIQHFGQRFACNEKFDAPVNALAVEADAVALLVPAESPTTKLQQIDSLHD